MRRAVLLILLTILSFGCHGLGRQPPRNPYEPNTPEYSLWNENQRLERRMRALEFGQSMDRINSNLQLQQHESHDFYQRQLERPFP